MRICWCGNADLLAFSPEYGECRACRTLVYLKDIPLEQSLVSCDETDFYGKKYWLDHQTDAFGYPDIYTRARYDLTERNLHWLKTLLKYQLPPAKVLELGCAHGSFVALLRQAGYDAFGIEMSPWVVEYGQKIFGVPISVGPIEALKIPLESLDVIVLMDVLEHLPRPAATMSHCLRLLKPNGLLLIQTPQFKEGMNYEVLMATRGSFLEQLKSKEHIYLFSERSVMTLFKQLRADHIQFEPAIFGHYDMFFAVSRLPFNIHNTDKMVSALLATPNGRIALALLDIYQRESKTVADQHGQLSQLEADKEYLINQLKVSEADRAARLEVINQQGQQLDYYRDKLALLKRQRIYKWMRRMGKWTWMEEE